MTYERSHSLRPHGGAEAVCPIARWVILDLFLKSVPTTYLLLALLLLVSLLINLFFESSLIM